MLVTVNSRVFITGISPLSLAEIGNGFNVAINLSFDEDVAGLCGLADTDIEAALKVCGFTSDYQHHLSRMKEFYHGYHFCDHKKVQTMYNTETCLSYLQFLIQGKEPRLKDPQNSEVSGDLLEILASSPCAIGDFEEALKPDERHCFQPIKYDDVKQSLDLPI